MVLFFAESMMLLGQKLCLADALESVDINENMI